MRVALITREFPPETSWGGIGTHYGALAHGLVRAGHEVEVFTQGLHRAETIQDGGVTVTKVVPRQHLVGPRRGGEFGGGDASCIGLFALSLARELRSAVRRSHRAKPFDVAEGHDHLGVNALLNRSLAREIGTVTRYQTAYHTMVARGLVDWPRSRLVTWLERTAVESAHVRIATSRHIDQLVREDFPGAPSAEFYVPNATRITPLTEEEVRSLKKEDLILFVGRMVPGHKNPHLAAEAFARVAEARPSWRIEFAGEDIPIGSQETMWGRCQTILQGLPGRYAYHGVLPPEGVRELMLRARVLVMPSAIESYGLTAVEAMSLGCVPIVSDDTALPDVVGPHGIVFRNGSALDLGSKLGSLLDDRPAIQERAMGCLERARTDLAVESVVAASVEAFEDAIRRSRQGTAA